MRKPEKPLPPGKLDLDQGDITNLFVLTMVHPDCTEGYEENWYDEEETECPAYVEWDYVITVGSLKELLDKVPLGVDLSTVKLVLHRDRNVHDLTVTLTSDKPVSSEIFKSDYDKAYAEYEIKLVQHNEDMIKYTEWKKTQEIAQKQREIARLQKELDGMKK